MTCFFVKSMDVAVLRNSELTVRIQKIIAYNADAEVGGVFYFQIRGAPVFDFGGISDKCLA
jgi:hypothetical protein